MANRVIVFIIVIMFIIVVMVITDILKVRHNFFNFEDIHATVFLITDATSS
jgi:hypothetical protein